METLSCEVRSVVGNAETGVARRDRRALARRAGTVAAFRAEVLKGF
jgi:hypothetical protein